MRKITTYLLGLSLIICFTACDQERVEPELTFDEKVEFFAQKIKEYNNTFQGEELNVKIYKLGNKLFDSFELNNSGYPTEYSSNGRTESNGCHSITDDDGTLVVCRNDDGSIDVFEFTPGCVTGVCIRHIATF